MVMLEGKKLFLCLIYLSVESCEGPCLSVVCHDTP